MSGTSAGAGSTSPTCVPGMLHGLKRKKEHAPAETDDAADQELGADQERQSERRGVGQQRLQFCNQQGREREGGDDRDEEANLSGNVDAGESRHEHQAGADAAEHDERRQNAVRKTADHDTAPSGLISAHRATSTCDRIGKVGKTRSRIIRT